VPFQKFFEPRGGWRNRVIRGFQLLVEPGP
jgi:hypothetical protein